MIEPTYDNDMGTELPPFAPKNFEDEGVFLELDLIKPFNPQEEIVGQEEKIGTELNLNKFPTESSSFVAT